MSTRPKRKAATKAEETFAEMGSPSKKAKKNPPEEDAKKDDAKDMDVDGKTEEKKDAEESKEDAKEAPKKKGRVPAKGKGKGKGKAKKEDEEEGEEGDAAASSASAPVTTPAVASGVPCPPLTADDSKYIKIISWNLNGLNAVMQRGDLVKYVELEKPDILCLQETKSTEEKVKRGILADYPHEYWSCSTAKKGYAGTALFSKIKPINVTYGLGKAEHDQEGRTIIAEFDKFYLVNTYVPNSGQKLDRLSYRGTWNADLLAKFKEMDKVKPIVWTGDLNVAHEEIDLAKPKGNNKTAGFTKEERRDFGVLLSSGFVDSFRRLNPGVQQFTFWTAKRNSRANNIGWRLDYFVVSERMFPDVASSFVRSQVYGSDHCPLGILLPRDKGYAA